MKPINLKIKGLNSFVEEQEIDFERLTEAGFFGIFGQTGSGKSTILDGITLALYGEVSRNSSNFINTNCDEVSVSYTFQISLSEVKRYNVWRNYKRSKKNGKITQKCRVTDLVTNSILADSISEVNSLCKEIIGLSFEDFTRTVVLPQGKFSEFLKLERGKRTEMLERLFNLQKYGDNLAKRISSENAKFKAEENQLIGEEKGYEGITEEVLSENREILNKYSSELELKKKEYDALKVKFESAKEVYELQIEARDYLRKSQELNNRKQEMELKESKLNLAKEAEIIMPYVKRAEDTKKNLIESKEAENNIQRKKEELEVLIMKSKEEFEKVEEAKLQRLPKLIIDKNNAEEALKISEDIEKCIKLKAKIEKDKLEYEVTLKNINKEISDIDDKIKEETNLFDSLKIEKTIKDKVKEAVLLLKEVEALDKNKAKYDEDLLNLNTEIRTQEVKLEALQKEKDNDNKELKNLESELEQLINNQPCNEEGLAEKKSMVAIAQHSDVLRKELENGKPCPVCGSMHYDLAHLDMNTNTKSYAREKEEYDNLYKAYQDFKKLKENQDLKIKEFNGKMQKKELELKEYEISIKAKREQKEKHNLELSKIKEDKEEIVYKLEILKRETSINDFEVELKIIEEKEEKREEIAKKLEDLRTKRDKNLEIREKISADINNYNIRLENGKTVIAEKEALLKEKVSNIENISKYLLNLNKEIDLINDRYTKIKAEYEKNDKFYKEISEKCASIKAKTKELANQIEEREEELKNVLCKSSFEEVAKVKESFIASKEELSNLEMEIDNYKKALDENKIQVENINKKLGNRSITEEEYQGIKALKEKQEEEIEKIKEIVIKKAQEINIIEKKLKEIESIINKKKVLEHKMALLSDLESLFKGKRFVEYVAINRLKYISKEASKRLFNISNGNYALEVNDEGKFIIIDNKNGGKRRETNTLSGGETFLASLSLALALSSQIQLKSSAPLELFFLDEGFGTLDEELLDVVMNSIEKVYNKNLTVGIITHVESIKNRVPIKLLVTPAEAGVSGSKVKIETN